MPIQCPVNAPPPASGYGEVTRLDGNEFTIDFEHPREKRVDSFVERN